MTAKLVWFSKDGDNLKFGLKVHQSVEDLEVVREVRRALPAQRFILVVAGSSVVTSNSK